MRYTCLLALTLVGGMAECASEAEQFAHARENGRQFERSAGAARRLLHAWLAHADTKTLLLPDRTGPGAGERVYRPHNSGADLYPYLILTAHLTDPDLYQGRMIEMLRNELRYTVAEGSIPGNLDLDTGKLGEASLFGAGEYAKDGLIAVTEYLGRTPWFFRMVDMIADAMDRAPIASRFGKLPASDTELNGDYLQALVRLAAMTGDTRFLEWARRIGDAYVEEVLPGNYGVPSGTWDFEKHSGDGRLRLRDHGNETVVGLTLLYGLEQYRRTERAEKYRPVIARMLDRIIESANPDGMLYNEVSARTLEPVSKGLSDNWGYVYGAVYAFYQSTGETKYRDAVRRVLANLGKYRSHAWEPGRDRGPLGSFDGYADAIEGAIYLANREPVAEARNWIDSEMEVMLGMQKPDGHVEYWYGEGNFNRTALLYAYSKSQGCRPRHWKPGMRFGAVRDGERLYLSIEAPGNTETLFDYARHRRIVNLDKNYVRLNEFPEWYTVDENRLYSLRRPRPGEEARVLSGAELVAGVVLAPGEWVVEPLAGRAVRERGR
jgi:hypothetical protein